MKFSHALVATGAAATLALAALQTSAAPSAPPELGQVSWGRNWKQALAQAGEQDKPALLLFDEVPGCQTCTRYGEQVLSHPLLVEAAETEFVAAAVYNNHPGLDREGLKRFGEPSWNNPVVRIVDENGELLAPRLAGDYTPEGLARTMVTALKAAHREVPPYLELLALRGRSQVVFRTGCFWSGQACAGRLDGVADIETGFASGGEAVRLRFDPDRTSEAAVIEAMAARGCSRSELLGSDFRNSPSDDDHALRGHPIRKLPLTRAQRIRVNSDVAAGRDPSRWLSPRQRRQYEAIRKAPDRFSVAGPGHDVDFRRAYDRVDALIARAKG